MKRSSQRKRGGPGPLKRQAEESETGTWRRTRQVLFWVLAGLIIGIPFTLGKYLEFSSPGPFDSGAYVYSAKHVLDGAQIGVDEKVTARMGTLLVNMLGVKFFGFSETGPKTMQALLQLAALIMMCVAICRLYGRWAAALSALVATFYLSAPLIAKFGNVKEQYMIACMMIGVSCFVLRQLGGRWWWSVLAGAFVAWGPLFKQTGLSAIAAVGLFAFFQALTKARSWKETGQDLGLLMLGATLSVGPIYVWMVAADVPFEYWPYAKIIRLVVPAEGMRVSSYIVQGRQMVDMGVVAARIFRWYGLLALPIALSLGSILGALISVMVSKLGSKKRAIDGGTRMVFMFGLWWVLDMAFVWISPRSYEQYFLPLNASAAMLGSFLLGAYFCKLKEVDFKIPWLVLGVIGLLAMMGTSWHIIFGIQRSPHSGIEYASKRRGYVQRLDAVKRAQANPGQTPWEAVARHIKTGSQPTDKIFVWGWVPGIYVQAQRMSAASYAFTSEMHVRSPDSLGEMITRILADFDRQKPKFIVDSRKRHFPWNRPPLELWPLVQVKRNEAPRFLSEDSARVASYEQGWSDMLRRSYDEAEAQRFRRMTPFRAFVRKHYRIVNRVGEHGEHVLFELDPSKADREPL
ncbi:MAG: glycosyltransferase family 39 protein [Planctomycetes bacterium]|nr:glycosyltransferase family 39 protein [Planctomycetota bacterium]